MYWVIIDKATREVFATESVKPPEGAYNSDLFEIRPLDYEPDQGTIIPEQSLEEVRAWALEQVNKRAEAQETALDNLLGGSFVRMVMLNTEIVSYFQAGRPANPSAAIYVIANAMATRRGNALRDMLETLFTRWRSIQSQLATLITEFDRVTEEIEAATTVDEIKTILSSLIEG